MNVAIHCGCKLIWCCQIIAFQSQVIHKYYCELHRETNFYPRQLVLFEIPKYNDSTEQSGKVAGLIPLDEVFRVEVVDKKCMFKIMTSDKQYQIRVHTFQEASNWVDAINNETIGPPVPGVVCEYNHLECSNKFHAFICR